MVNDGRVDGVDVSHMSVGEGAVNDGAELDYHGADCNKDQAEDQEGLEVVVWAIRLSEDGDVPRDKAIRAKIVRG